MTRTREEGALSSQQRIALENATFVPARERARISLAMPRAFRWPADNDAAIDDKLKALVNATLASTSSFVLFDNATRTQVDFPAGWEELKVASVN
jgi:hypothetical protein